MQDEVVDYKKQDFAKVLRGYNDVLGTVREDAIEKSIGILKPGEQDRLARRSAGRCIRSRPPAQLHLDVRLRTDEPQDHAPGEKQDIAYYFSLRAPMAINSRKSASLIEKQRIRPVIDKVFPFEQAKEALEYLALGVPKAIVVVRVQ